MAYQVQPLAGRILKIHPVFLEFIEKMEVKTWKLMKKWEMVPVFTQPDVDTWEVGRTRDKRGKPRREAEWFPAYRVFSQLPKCLHQAM